MAARRKTESEPTPSRRRRATTPEARENQLVASAYDLAERQIQQGTASSQVITHFLKLGTEREKLEREKIRRENELLEARKEALASTGRMEELMEEAINAFRSYSGQSSHEEEYFDD